jgi:hypothetical protein
MIWKFLAGQAANIPCRSPVVYQRDGPHLARKRKEKNVESSGLPASK